MATYVLLGATGATGSAVLRCLLDESPSIKTLRIFVRSEAKLLKAFPSLDAPFRVDISENTPSDTKALQACLRGADIVFNCIATNSSTRDVSVCHDTAQAIVEACGALQRDLGPSYKAPTIIQLRSASHNDVVAGDNPPWPTAMVKYCLLYCYADIQRGCDLLRETATTRPSLLNAIMVDPPGLHDPEGEDRTGHMLSTTQLPGHNLNYADLGAGICEIAARRDEFKNQAVLVSSTGEVRTNFSTLAGFLLTGLKARWLG